MDDDLENIVPYHTLPYREGNKVLRKYVEDFEDSVGNKANITYVDYEDKKGKLVEKFCLYIKWKENE